VPAKLNYGKGGTLLKQNSASLAAIYVMLRNKQGEYTEKDFEEFLSHFKAKDQIKIRKMEEELRG